MAVTYEKIATTTLSTTAASVTFSSISSAFTDLYIVVNARGNNAGTTDQVALRFNSDTSTNYSRTILYGTGSAAASARTSNDSKILIDYVAGDTAAAGTFGGCYINVMNYANTTTYKTVLSRAGTAGDLVEANVGLWRATPAAISTVLIYPGIGSQWLTGSSFTLYGIKAA